MMCGRHLRCVTAVLAALVAAVLAASPASAQRPTLPSYALSPGEAQGLGWCADAQVASPTALANLSTRIQAVVAEAERPLILAQVRFDTATAALRRAETTRSGDAATQAADAAFTRRRNLVARVNTLPPGPELNLARLALAADEQSTGKSLQALIADARSARGSADLQFSGGGDVPTAKAELEAARRQLASATARVNTVRAQRNQARDCISERREQLGGSDGPTQAAGPAAPRPRPSDIRGVSGTVSGEWTAACTYDGQKVDPRSGSVNLTFDGRGRVAGAFVEGMTVSVTGDVDENGSLDAEGSVVAEGTAMALIVRGTVRVWGGRLDAYGTFTNSGEGVDCKGSWG